MLGKQLIQAAAGAAGAGGGALYVDDVFSTFLYNGNGGTQTITNGIDLSGEGGAVILKRRSPGAGTVWTDTARGANKHLRSDNNNQEYTETNILTAFNSNGFSIGSEGDVNQSGLTYASWTFRKAPGFFDCVTYTGNATAGRTVAHNLGSVPGFIIVKCTSQGAGWWCYHRSLGNDYAIRMDSTAAKTNAANYWNDTTPTSTEFTLGDYGDTNGSGKTFVAYIFAHDDQSFGTDSDESIIKCGSYTGSSSGVNINLGFEPQWVMVKRSDGTGSWYIMDTMRGFTASNDPVTLKADSADAEGGLAKYRITSTGFDWNSDSGDSGQEYIYMAIRRPNKPPTAGTDVFFLKASTENAANSLTPGFVPDFFIYTRPNETSFTAFATRTRGKGNALRPQDTAAEDVDTNNNFFHWDAPTGTFKSEWFGGTTYFLRYLFKRAPGFMDIVVYNGTGSARTVNHNLSAIPELVIVKKLNGGGTHWGVYNSFIGNTKGLNLNRDKPAESNSTSDLWNNTSPTLTNFSVNTRDAVNTSNDQYIAFLFATLSGISKVGNYTGTGNDVNVDCGFGSGARFVLIKRTDSDAEWFLFDTARGIVSGNDPYLLLSTTGAQVTNTDYIDPLNSGFTVTSSAPTGLNASGGTYIFLAIA